MGAAVAELEHLALDPAVAPARILAGESEDEILDLRVEAAPASRRSTMEGGPLAANQFAMPSEERLGTGEEGGGPGRTRDETAESGQEEAIGCAPFGTGDLPFQDPELMAEGQDFGLEASLGPMPDDDRVKEQAGERVGK